jgi:hypothetical protein
MVNNSGRHYYWVVDKIPSTLYGLLMNDFHKDILTGTVFAVGIIGFISGEFIISSTLFASAAIASNVNINRKRGKAGQ